jgi:DNA polymerase III subunit epsilon
MAGNRYDEPCAACQQLVPAQSGRVRREGTDWRAYHDSCLPVRVAPRAGSHDGWHRGPLAGFDFESTSPDPQTARILSAALAPTAGPSRSWLVDPGVPIPPAASAVNGLTDEQVRRDGRPAAEALAQIGAALAEHIAHGVPLVAFNAAYDVTLLHHELARHGLPAVDWSRAHIIDPFVLHTRVEQYWSGSRKLGDLCVYYGVELTGAHTADGDTAATVLLAQAIAARHPRLAAMSLPDLHAAQVRWYREQKVEMQAYLRRIGRPVDLNVDWPLETAARAEPDRA